jgi:hypothetical protein
MSRRKKYGRDEVIVIKPAWWRQLAFTLFLFVMVLFFAVLNFGLRPINYGCVTVIGAFALLNLFDQLFAWSRLRIDSHGYSLRSWFRRVELRRDEVADFLFSEYMGRKLILVKLTESAARERGLAKPEMPYPCRFGRPVDEVFETLSGTLPARPASEPKPSG